LHPEEEEFEQVTHSPIPAALPVWLGQLEHTELPLKKLNFPAGHGAHWVAPLNSLYFPATHCVHTVAIAALAYVPVSHWMHSPNPGGQYDPGEHDASTSWISSADGVVFASVVI
jgi:hypothetical protein